MAYECEFCVGDLVEYRSWYDGENGWVSIDGMVGIVLEIIEITCKIETSIFNEDDVLYDVKVYWYTDGHAETVPDLLLDHYKPSERIKF